MRIDTSSDGFKVGMKERTGPWVKLQTVGPSMFIVVVTMAIHGQRVPGTSDVHVLLVTFSEISECSCRMLKVSSDLADSTCFHGNKEVGIRFYLLRISFIF